MSEGKRAALLLRVSSQDQEKGYSLGAQEADCRAYCEAKGYEVVAVHDDTKSGALLIGARPGARRLLEDAKAGRFDVAVVWKYDRVFRDDDGLSWFAYELRRVGVRGVESVTDDIPDGPFGSMFRAFKGSQAKQQWEDIRLNSMRGVRARVEKDKNHIPGNRPRFGYIWADDSHRAKGSYIENPETAWVVRLIFERIAAGTPVKTLCRELEERGIPAPQGGQRWRTFTLGSIVECSFYKGEAYAYVVHPEKDPITGKRTRTPEETVAFPEGTVPALVAPAFWQAANDRLRTHDRRKVRSATGEDPEDVVVRGHVRCRCGYCMHIKRLADGPYLNC